MSPSCSSLALLNATNGHLFPLPVSATRPQTSNTANVNGENSPCNKRQASLILSNVNVPRRCSSRALSIATNRDLFPFPVSARRPHTSNTADVNGTKMRCNKIKISNLQKCQQVSKLFQPSTLKKPPTAIYFHFRFPRRDPKRRKHPISMRKIRRVINDKLHDLIKCQHAPTLFRPSTLKRHKPRLISTSGFRDATPNVVGGV